MPMDDAESVMNLYLTAMERSKVLMMQVMYSKMIRMDMRMMMTYHLNVLSLQHQMNKSLTILKIYHYDIFHAWLTPCN